MKVIIVGNGGTGKTSLTLRFTADFFNESYKATTGVNFSVKELNLNDGDEVVPVKLQIWDTAGQERYDVLRPLFYQGARSVMIVYDVTRRRTFEDIPKWISELTSVMKRTIPVILVGNKIDLSRYVPEKEAELLAKRNGWYYTETSAKTGTSVIDAFIRLAGLALEDFERDFHRNAETGPGDRTRRE